MKRFRAEDEAGFCACMNSEDGDEEESEEGEEEEEDEEENEIVVADIEK